MFVTRVFKLDVKLFIILFIFVLKVAKLLFRVPIPVKKLVPDLDMFPFNISSIAIEIPHWADCILLDKIDALVIPVLILFLPGMLAAQANNKTRIKKIDGHNN